VKSAVDMDVTRIPFNVLVGIERAQGDGALLQLPSDPRYLNHVGTVHASALLALAEASSGEFILRHFRSLNDIVPVVRRLDAKFRKPAKGLIVSSASVAPDALTHLDAELATKGRSLVRISVELRDQSGIHVASATVEWFIQRASRSSAKA
jgi:acyl-coenzyme A thioesterase PaaI-like protein